MSRIVLPLLFVGFLWMSGCLGGGGHRPPETVIPPRSPAIYTSPYSRPSMLTTMRTLYPPEESDSVPKTPTLAPLNPSADFVEPVVRTVFVTAQVQHVPEEELPLEQMVESQRSELAQREEDLVAKEEALFESLDAALASIGGPSLAGERRTLEALVPAVLALKLQAENLATTHDEFLAALAHYKEGLAAFPATAKQLAAQNRRYADDEPYDDLRETYSTTAEMFEALGVQFAARAKSLQADEQAVEESFAYLERQALMLDRLSTALEALPALPAGYTPDELLDGLKTHAQRSQRLRDALKSFHQKLVSPQAISPTVKALDNARRKPKTAPVLASALHRGRKAAKSTKSSAVLTARREVQP